MSNTSKEESIGDRVARVVKNYQECEADMHSAFRIYETKRLRFAGAERDLENLKKEINWLLTD